MLSIKHIKLHNFRGIHGTLDWQFHDQPGFYFVQGQNLKEPTLGANGAGKSTIFVDGPYWVLTGKTILSQRPGTSIEPWGVERETVYGELILVIDNKEYSIRRGRNPSVLTINTRTVEQNDINKLIPLSDSALRCTLLLGQRSSMFLDLRPEEKSRLFSETLDLEIWLRAADLAGEKLKLKEREAIKINTAYAGISGSINEVRDQHETAANQEAEFEQQYKTRLEELLAVGRDEAQKHDTLKNALREAQERLKKLSTSSTSEDELHAQRSRERVLRDSVVTLTNELTQRTRRDAELTRLITIYNDSKLCPECGQPVTDQHIHTRKTELLTEQEQNKQWITKLPLSINDVKTQIASSEKITLAMEQSSLAYVELKHNANLLQERETMQERAVIRAVNEIKKQENTSNPYTTLCDQLETRYNQLREEREELIKKEETINTEIEILKFWQKGYRDIRLQQIDTTLLELELATNRNATSLGLQDWEIQFATERETKSGNTSHVFSIFLFPPGQTKPVSWDSYSGGEAQRWQLAVTFGLSEVLLARAGIDPDIEILDEITNHLSDVGIDDLLVLLHERAHTLQRRIYLIDHRVYEKGDFDGIVTVTKDESGIRIDS